MNHLHPLQYSHVEQELITISENTIPPPVFSVALVAQSLAYCVIFNKSLFVLLSFFVAIVLSVVLNLQYLFTPFVSTNVCFDDTP